MPMGLSIREFARRDGCSEMLVRRAIKQNRINTLSDGSLDPILVGTAWRKSNVKGANTANTPLKSVRSVPASVSNSDDDEDAAREDESLSDAALRALQAEGAQLDYGEALRVKENYIAKLRQLEYEQKSGALVAMVDAEGVLFELFRGQRDAWLGWPAKIGPILAAELGIEEADRVTELLTVHVHKQISDLGEPDTDFGPKKD